MVNLMLTNEYLKFQTEKQPDRRIQCLHAKIIRTENIIKLVFLKACQNIFLLNKR